MDKIELIKNFTSTFKNLPLQDKERLDNFRDQLDKAICEMYGIGSSYRQDLKKVRFTPRSFYATEEDYLESWSGGIKNVINLLDDIRLREEENGNVAQLHHEHLGKAQLNPSDQSYPNFQNKESSLPPLNNHSSDPAPIEKTDTHGSSGPDEQPQFNPDFAPESASAPISIPQKDAISDYILELEFAPDSQTINIDDIQNLHPADSGLDDSKDTRRSVPLFPPTSAPKPANAGQNNLQEKSQSEDKAQKSKVEQLESAIEKIRKTKLKDMTIPVVNGSKDNPSGEFEVVRDVHPSTEHYGKKKVLPIFVTYGYNEVMKDDVVATLQRLDFEVILRKKFDDEEKSIVKNFFNVADVGFAIVILSGDDFGYPKDHESHQAKVRPRQQLVFELGFLVGKLDRDNVFVLHQDSKNFEFPTGFFDLAYNPYSKMGGWQMELLRQLRRAGYSVDANKLL